MTPCDAELVDGEYIERRRGDYIHGRLQGLVASTIALRERGRGFHTFLSLTVRLRKNCYRIADIAIKALPYRKAATPSHPDLAIEIVAPDDEPAEMLAKIGDYLAAGIPDVWVIDPYRRTVVEANPSGIRKVNSQKLSTPLVGEVDFAALFAQLDEPSQ